MSSNCNSIFFKLMSVLTLIFLQFHDRLDDFESDDLSGSPLHFDHLHATNNPPK